MNKLTLPAFLVLLTLQAHAQLPEQTTPTVSIIPTGFNLDWYGHGSRTYFVEYSADLTNWAYMPVIESGVDAALGYGFSTPGDKLFLRVRYTDTVTSNPNSADFDGDGVSNWDEVRIGGTGTDPFEWDTDGDGKSDYFSDIDNNSLADGWEIQYYGSTGTADPTGNDDDDTLSNYEESLMGSDPNNEDTDDDNINDDAEAVWWDNRVKWQNTTQVQYAVIELSGLTPTADNYNESSSSSEKLLQLYKAGELIEEPASEWEILALSNDGHVLVREDLRHPTKIEQIGSIDYNTGLLVPGTIPDSIRNHVWSPSTAEWFKLDSDTLEGGQTVLSEGTDIATSGVVLGYAWVPLQDGLNNPTVLEKAAVKWPVSALAQKASPLSPLSALGTPYSSFAPNYSVESVTQNFPKLRLTQAGNVLDLPSELDASTRNGDVFNYDDATGTTKFKIDNLGSGEPVVDGQEKAGGIKSACRIRHTDPQANVDIAAYGAGLWARQDNAWVKVKPHPVTPLTGVKGISDDLTILLEDGKSVMRNGRVYPLSELTSGGNWSDFRMARMNDLGMMVGRAKKDEGADKIVLMLPIRVEWVPITGYDNVDDHIDPWTNKKNGNRIFPGYKNPNETTEIQHKLSLRVSGGLPGMSVFAMAFDVDDSTSEAFDEDPDTGAAVIDTGGKAGNDNSSDPYSIPLAGQFWQGGAWGIETVTGTTDASGEYDVDFRVGIQPGNNYRVVVFVGDVPDPQVTGAPQVTNPSGQNYLGTGNYDGVGIASPLLTVWRKLWIENDSMEAISVDALGFKANHVANNGVAPGTISTVSLLPNGNTRLSIASNQYAQMLSQLENGEIQVNGVRHSIIGGLGGTWNAPSIEVATDLTSKVGQKYRLYDDDDFGIVLDALPRLDLVDDTLKDVFKSAFIKVVDAVAYNPRKLIDFYRNHPVATNPGIPNIFDDSLDLVSLDGLWVGNLIAGYQGFQVDDDSDPNGTPGLEGGTPQNSRRYSVVFVETIRDQNDLLLRSLGAPLQDVRAKIRRNIRLTAAHELGHMPGGGSGGSHHAEQGMMDSDGYSHSIQFAPQSIKRFRQTLNWQQP